jgi:F-type H+-transporting ATPase subunit epsilon
VAGTLQVEILTPEAALWSGDATALMARSSDGQFTVLAHHTSTVGDLVPGVIRVSTSEGERDFLIHGGFFQVTPDGEATRATVLAGVGEAVSVIDVARAQAAKDAAEAALSSRGEDEDDASLAEARGALARANLRLAQSTKVSS